MQLSPEVEQVLSAHQVDRERGFLPGTEPLRSLPSAFAVWEQVAAELPKLLMTDLLRRELEDLPPFPVHRLAAHQLERAMMLLSYIGHAYVWTGEPARRLPANLAVPWHYVAMKLGRPPVLSYASYALHNWRRFDADRDVELGNIALLQNFWGGADEEWFILVHVDIERKAGPLLVGLVQAKHAARDGDVEAVTRALLHCAAAQEQMYATLCRMPQWCDPYIYYRRVRPYIHGWKANPALPDGLVYEGVSEYGGKGQFFRGETGAQSSIVPAIDAVLGITHAPGLLNDYLMEMRTYMPPAHRRFIEYLEAGPSVRPLVGRSVALKDAYNRCVELQEGFRAKHYEYAANYIYKQGQADAQTAGANPTAIGTGGTPFMPYLKKHLDETRQHRVG
ncbi:MAG: hypothetical protein ACK4PI_12280 [Tepidisphaerales bacterium]